MVGGPLAAQDGIEAIYEQGAHGVAGSFGGTADVWRQEYTVAGAVAGMDIGFAGEDIQASSKDMAAVQGREQRFVIDQLSPGDIDHDGGRRQQLQVWRVDDPLESGRPGRSHHEDVAVAH